MFALLISMILPSGSVSSVLPPSGDDEDEATSAGMGVGTSPIVPVAAETAPALSCCCVAVAAAGVMVMFKLAGFNPFIETVPVSCAVVAPTPPLANCVVPMATWDVNCGDTTTGAAKEVLLSVGAIVEFVMFADTAPVATPAGLVAVAPPAGGFKPKCKM